MYIFLETRLLCFRSHDAIELLDSTSFVSRVGMIVSRLGISVRVATRAEIYFRTIEKGDNSYVVLRGLFDGAANNNRQHQSLATWCQFHFWRGAAVIIQRVLFRSDRSNR